MTNSAAGVLSRQSLSTSEVQLSCNTADKVLTRVRRSVKHQKSKTQLALLRLNNSRKSLFVPDILLPCVWRTAILDQPTIMYKVVAAAHGKLLSIYDGSTQYKLGQTLHAKRGGAAWAPLDACYFVFPNLQQVTAAPEVIIPSVYRDK